MRYYRKKSAIWKILGLLCALGLLFATYQYLRYQQLLNTAVDPENTESLVFTINKGDSIPEIAGNLDEQQLIIDKDTFRTYLKFSGLDKQIKSGRYALSPDMTIKKIVEVLSSGKQVEAILTIPEGFEISEIDSLLTKENLIESGEFTNAVKNFDNYERFDFLDKNTQKDLAFPLEGYLFPDTYYVSATAFTSEKLIAQMLENFESKTANLWEASARNIRDIIIIASMIEKEANKDKDRPLISGIIWKRLDEKWLLGIDATLLYQKHNNEITYEDLQKDSPYNTRKNAGLPPGPICNPGLASIKAAFNPETSDYYYYLTSKDGEMIYSRTDAEHNYNKAKYL